jgi:hypothetical protein
LSRFPWLLSLTLFSAIPVFGQEAIPVSLINLISTPKEFHLKKVSVSGYLIFRLEDQSLCLLPSPPSRRECVWVQMSPDHSAGEKEQRREYVKWQSMSGQIVTLEGIFDMNDEGHIEGWSGGIKTPVIWGGRVQIK